MTLPLRGPCALSSSDVSGVGELYETYGKLIGHRYVLHDGKTPGGTGSYANISVLEACATQFDGGSLRFDMSASHQGLDLVILSFGLSGQALCYRQRGVECVAEAGSAILHTTDALLNAQSDRAGTVMAVALPRTKLGALIADPDALSVRVLHADCAALSLFAGHARSFLSLGTAPDAGLARLVGDQLCDLAALALGVNNRGKDKIISGEALNDVRYDRAMQYIGRHLADPNLCEKQLARHLGLSTSSVRQIFARKRTTPARVIRKARVEMAASLLTDGGHHARKIVSVAFDCGFRSVSAFYEAFRDHYGMHPSDLRAAASREMPD